jgi:hypothetical protein
MSRSFRYIAVAILILGVVGVAMGIGFVVEGQLKANFIVNSMREEQVTLGDIGIQGAQASELIDSAATAQLAADTIKGHRQSIYPTYDALVKASATGKFDPTNTKDLAYAQAMNLENYLYLGVASLGLATVVTVSGIFMIVTGIAVGGTGLVLFRLARRTPPGG